MPLPTAEPFNRFAAIFEAAKAAQPKDPNQVCLATVDESGRPSARMVLLKGFNEQGFVFFTNYESDKAKDIEATGRAAMCFYWPSLEEQVRLDGRVERLTAAESDEYFATRPRESQLGAWASRQSQPIPSRAVLEEWLADVTARFEGQPVPRPPGWGGLRLAPERFEFWKAHPFRLHWRERYLRVDGGWERTLLSP